jgi:hypothetical protein
MVVLVTVETAILALMALLVVGLLRSHAEILRRLESLAPPSGGPSAAELGSAQPDAGTTSHLPPARDTVTPAFDIVGTTLDGDAVKLTMATGRPGGTVLAFLSSGCTSCHRFWDGMREGRPDSLPGAPRVVPVTKDTSHESPSKLRELAGPELPLVMSSRAWEDYRIAGSPYFVHVDPHGNVVGEGTAESWPQVASLLRDAMDDAVVAARLGRGSTGPAERLRRADLELASAGIGPGHPSLYGKAGEEPDSADDPRAEPNGAHGPYGRDG